MAPGSSAWEAAFLVGVFPDAAGAAGSGGAPRWAKVQIFSGGRNPRRHCLSAVEGMDGPPATLVAIGRPAGVEETGTRSGEVRLDFRSGAWDVDASGITWRGVYPSLELRCSEPEVHATTESGDVLWWARIPGVLSYWSALSRLTWNGAEGLGLVERAWGCDMAIDPARVFRAPWHWDVLAWREKEAGPISACAGLALDLHLGMRGLRSGGSLASAEGGNRFVTGHGLRVRVREWRDEEGRHVPVRWDATMKLGSAKVTYRATASTPVLAAVPHGGFLGFDFEGHVSRRGAADREVAGAGFCEYRAGGGA